MVKEIQNEVKRTPTWTGPCFWSCFGTITRSRPTYQATWWEEAWTVIGHIGWVSGDGMVGGRSTRSNWWHASTMDRLQFHAVGQGHLVFNAFFVLRAPWAAGARRWDARVRGRVFGRSRGKGEEVRTGVTGGQGGGRGWGVNGQGPGGAVVQRSLGERAQVPGRSAVMRADAFAAIEPWQRAVD